MNMTKPQKDFLIKILNFMKKNHYEISIDIPVDIPECLADSGAENEDLEISFLFYIDDIKKMISYLDKDKSFIRNINKYRHKYSNDMKTYKPKKDKWTMSPCDDIAGDVEIDLEGILDEMDSGIAGDGDFYDDLGVSYQGAFVGNTEI